MIKRRKAGVALIAVAALAGVGLVDASSAWACAALPNSSHCYGSWTWRDPAPTLEGISADIRPTCLTVPSSGMNFATDEIWLLESLSAENWIEVGWIVQRESFGSAPVGVPFGFWYDHRPGSIGYFHVLLNEPLQSAHVSITRATPHSFQVYFDGAVATSTNNSMSTQAAQVGSEITTVNARSYASFSGMYWGDGVTWRPRWTSSSYGSFGQNPPNTFAWTTPGSAAWAGASC